MRIELTQATDIVGPDGTILKVRIRKGRLLVTIIPPAPRSKPLANSKVRGRPPSPATARLRTLLAADCNSSLNRTVADYIELYREWNPGTKSGDQIVRREVRRQKQSYQNGKPKPLPMSGSLDSLRKAGLSPGAAKMLLGEDWVRLR